MRETHPSSTEILQIAGTIISSYVSHNHVNEDALPELIAKVFHELRSGIGAEAEMPLAHRAPAVPVEKSVTEDHIVCLEDGKELRSLTRYLKRAYGLTPEQYRQKWNLPADYPMSAPALSERRSALAKERFRPRAQAGKTAAERLRKHH